MLISPDHIFWLLIVSILCGGIAIVLAYLSRWEAVVAAFVSLLTGYLSHFITLGDYGLWFWGVASLIVLGISMLLPSEVRDSRKGVAFFATGALVGAFIGMLFNTASAVIVASAVGVVLAAVAFCRLPDGRELEFPSRKFFNYLCAKGLPLVVIFSMIGIVSLQLIVLGSIA